MSKLLIGFRLILAFTLGIIIPITVFDVYGLQEKYHEQANAGFSAGIVYGTSFEQCENGRFSDIFHCDNFAKLNACSYGISTYLSICNGVD